MFKRLHNPPKSTNKWIVRFLGSNYDSISDDYKVIMIYCGEPFFQVYSTKCNSWTELQPSIINNLNAY